MTTNQDVPRIPFEDLREDIADSLRAKFERLGYLGEFFSATAHQPDALMAFILFTDAAKAELDLKSVELIALTVATMKAVAYEKNQHERLSVKSGFGRKWVAAVEALAPERHDTLSESEKRMQRFVIEAVRADGKNITLWRRALCDDLGHVKTIAVMMVMARYTSHALLVNALDIGAPVPSIFDNTEGG